MARWEYCQLEISGIEKQAQRSAVVYSSQGRAIIDATPVMDERRQQTQFENECAKLVGRLGADWIRQWSSLGF